MDDTCGFVVEELRIDHSAFETNFFCRGVSSCGYGAGEGRK